MNNVILCCKSAFLKVVTLAFTYQENKFQSGLATNSTELQFQYSCQTIGTMINQGVCHLYSVWSWNNMVISKWRLPTGNARHFDRVYKQTPLPEEHELLNEHWFCRGHEEYCFRSHVLPICYLRNIWQHKNWYRIDFSVNSLRKHIFLKSWGIHLVYADDLLIFSSWSYLRWGVLSLLYICGWLLVV